MAVLSGVFVILCAIAGGPDLMLQGLRLVDLPYGADEGSCR